MNENEIAKVVFDAALTVHKSLGPGLLEKAYESCLSYELTKRGVQVERQKPQPVVYDKEVMEDVGYILDLLVEGKFIVEIKSVEALTDVHKAQLLTYLRLSKCKLGYLINFNVSLLKNGVKRMIQGQLNE